MRAHKKLWRNRKARKELARRLQSENPGLEVVHPNAAGIDVGNSAHYVAVRPDRDSHDGGGKKLGHFGGVSGTTVVVDIWNMEARVTSARADSRLKSGRAVIL